MHAFLLVVSLLLAAVASAESISFEIYELKSDGAHELIAKGTKEYAVRDIEVQESLFGERFWLKEIVLTDHFAVGASVHHHQELVGFALWVKQRSRWFELWKSEGFSWDWFDREKFPTVRRGLIRPSHRASSGSAPRRSCK